MEYGTDAFYDLGRMQETIQALDKADMEMWKVPPVPWHLGDVSVACSWEV